MRLSNGDLVVNRPHVELGLWLSQRVGTPFGIQGDTSFVGLERDGRLKAVIAYSRYVKPNIEMHVAGEGLWCFPEFLTILFSYPFTQLNCGRITAIVARDNTRIRKLIEHLGFSQEGLLRKALPQGDAVVYGMLREECPWLLQKAA